MATYRISATLAARQFGEMLRRSADGGDEVLIQRHRKVVARLVPASSSPVRWYDFVRTARRERSPDTGFWEDLADLRGLRGRSRSGPFRAHELTSGTVLLDSTLIVDVHRHRLCLESKQRVATTAAAVAELSWVAALRGRWIQAVRINYIARVVGSIPVLSLDQLAALELVSPTSQQVGRQPFLELARATAMSVYWPLVCSEGAPRRGAAKRKAARGYPDGSLERPSSEVFV